ncbi:hypothetical protein C0585_05540 [Candidatus Woesearchaeota archaeon]|nr:MAG: hypothetical protein C0585_05540 [Candidatus Woesearchaeota archaeon]
MSENKDWNIFNKDLPYFTSPINKDYYIKEVTDYQNSIINQIAGLYKEKLNQEGKDKSYYWVLLDGSFGTGKSTIDEAIIDKLKDTHIPIYITPYSFSTSNRDLSSYEIANIFFNTISNVLYSKGYLPAKFDLIKFNLLRRFRTMNSSPWFSIINEFLNHTTEIDYLEQINDFISDKINKEEKNLLIIFQDLDRLSKEEFLAFFSFIRLLRKDKKIDPLVKMDFLFEYDFNMIQENGCLDELMTNDISTFFNKFYDVRYGISSRKISKLILKKFFDGLFNFENKKDSVYQEFLDELSEINIDLRTFYIENLNNIKKIKNISKENKIRVFFSSFINGKDLNDLYRELKFNIDSKLRDFIGPVRENKFQMLLNPVEFILKKKNFFKRKFRIDLIYIIENFYKELYGDKKSLKLLESYILILEVISISRKMVGTEEISNSIESEDLEFELYLFSINETHRNLEIKNEIKKYFLESEKLNSYEPLKFLIEENPFLLFYIYMNKIEFSNLSKIESIVNKVEISKKFKEFFIKFICSTEIEKLLKIYDKIKGKNINFNNFEEKTFAKPNVNNLSSDNITKEINSLFDHKIKNSLTTKFDFIFLVSFLINLEKCKNFVEQNNLLLQYYYFLKFYHYSLGKDLIF